MILFSVTALDLTRANTLMYRADTVVSDDDERVKEKEHISSVLQVNGYPQWLLKEERKDKTRASSSTGDGRPAKRQHVVIPHVKGVSERLWSAFGKFRIPPYFKPTNTTAVSSTKGPITEREDSWPGLPHPMSS